MNRRGCESNVADLSVLNRGNRKLVLWMRGKGSTVTSLYRRGAYVGSYSALCIRCLRFIYTI